MANTNDITSTIYYWNVRRLAVAILKGGCVVCGLHFHGRRSFPPSLSFSPRPFPTVSAGDSNFAKVMPHSLLLIKFFGTYAYVAAVPCLSLLIGGLGRVALERSCRRRPGSLLPRCDDYSIRPSSGVGRSNGMERGREDRETLFERSMYVRPGWKANPTYVRTAGNKVRKESFESVGSRESREPFEDTRVSSNPILFSRTRTIRTR